MGQGPLFEDRSDAGRRLAPALVGHAGRGTAVVLGLPRGGVPVAAQVARALELPLDVYVVRKLGVPGHQELAMGAIASGGVRVLNDDVIRAAAIDAETLERVTVHELSTVVEQERLFRGGRVAVELGGQTAILVDDGLATGATMRAAVAAVRAAGAPRVVVAVPVAPVETCAALRREADELVCLLTPESFVAVGAWYRDFTSVSDDEVRRLLEAA
jgi:putative phosphoribosyl transferase